MTEKETTASAALEPFAKALEEASIGTPDTVSLWFHPSAMGLTVGDLRRARTAYDAIGAGVKGLEADDVEWVVNDIAELGVKIGEQFFFLYKGRSLVYGALNADPTVPPVHDDETPMHWRPVLKREFGECAHPVNYKDPSRIGTVSLEDSDEWKPLPAACLSTRPAPSTPSPQIGKAGAGPVGETVVCDILTEWQDAYSAFVGAFDTAIGRLRSNNEYEADARRRLREFNDRLLASPRPVEPGEVERLTRELAEEKSEVDRLTDENSDLRSEPWPEWATAVLKAIRERSGYDGYDDTSEGVDLPAELDECMDELESAEAHQRTRAETAETALAETRGLIRDAIGLVPLAHQNWHTDARAALTGDAQEGGK